MKSPGEKPQYAHSVYADPTTAQEFDQSRFGGEVGQYVAMAQQRVLTEFLGDLHGDSALDVGCGTGRAALVLRRLGASVTALDSSPEMLRVGIANAKAAEMHIDFRLGDANSLDFPNAGFDVVISLRMLMHTPDWERCLAEMCRVARRRLAFDYPPVMSASLLQVLFRRLARLMSQRVEAYHVISTAAVRALLNDNGFRVVRLHRQFVLPIALHKWIGSRRFTERSETAFAAVGLLRLVGSPVTILAERCSGDTTDQTPSETSAL